MSHSSTPPVSRKRASLTTQSSRLRYVSAVEHQTVEHYFKTDRTKPRKHPEKKFIIKYSPELPQDTKPLRSCSEAQNLLKSHLGSRGVKRCHGSVSGSALACRACKSCLRPGFESRVMRVSQFKKSQTTVSTTEHHTFCGLSHSRMY